MKVAIPKETADGERRVALVPDTATKLIGAGLQVSIQAGAGASAHLTDSVYQAAGVTLESDESALFQDAGFAAIDLGDLATGGEMQQIHHPLAGVNLIRL